MAAVMKGVPVILLFLLECCKASSPTTTVTATQIAAELEDAGCVAPGPGVADAVAAELATGHDAWLACMADGGSVASCDAPCTR